MLFNGWGYKAETRLISKSNEEWIVFVIEFRLTQKQIFNNIKGKEEGGVHLKVGYGILAPKFRFFVQMTWKIEIVECLDAFLR